MTEEEFRELVRRMRYMQSAYFACKAPDSKRELLIQSKELERAVDRELSHQKALL